MKDKKAVRVFLIIIGIVALFIFCFSKDYKKRHADWGDSDQSIDIDMPEGLDLPFEIKLPDVDHFMQPGVEAMEDIKKKFDDFLAGE